ncbi:hypothetical protein PRECH8_04860 [Insulibacter thermoxylanivorax]|uniref:DUF1832 domain-containing protein n=1 Tax=Insulibacter thermoxylanivorax TaxID=2749268 RepID=A0A916VG52_9BACL|nr:hypothetical protein [Insulibacter thermoxylanivorax]GFR37190.1 hypothetical protein PRECH8_04860 [Insulibacter thermoxylanivorax]
MANRKFVLSKEATELLDRVIVELNIPRPEALRLALAKGLVDAALDEIPQQLEGGGFEVPHGVIAKDDDYVMYKHLIIEKLHKPIDDKDIDPYMHKLIEAGLRIMGNEMDQLSSLDNYLLYLVEKPARGS